MPKVITYPKPACEDCVFVCFGSHGPRCHKSAPVADVRTGLALWPRVSMGSSCGEFKRNLEKKYADQG